MSGGTSRIAPGSSFEADPLGWLDAAAAEGAAVRWLSARDLCVLDADAARALLKNEEGLLVRHSDFFGPVEGALGPRPAQVALARAAHALAQRHARSLDYSAHAERLGARSRWPGAGNRLLLEMMRPILASADRPREIHSVIDFIVEDRIANREAGSARPWTRLLRRFSIARAILKETRACRADREPADMLDIVAGAKEGMGDGGRVHLYLALIFALVGSIGFALGWAVLLAARHGRTDAPPHDLVREALRLFPVAWLLERSPAVETAILGERITPAQVVVISPYAIHRSPTHWPDPAAFLPERWQRKSDRGAWLPFGAGSQSCVAASLSVDIASDLLRAILARPVAIEDGDGPPSVRAALAPPPFTLVRAG